jgi:hypothetical protein
MSRNTFILIVSVYSLALGLFMLFAPASATAYFGGDTANTYQVALFRFIGVLDAGLGIIGLLLWRYTNQEAMRVALLGFTWTGLASLAAGMYNAYVVQIPLQSTAYVDWAIWGGLGLGSLYFWNKKG